MGTIRQGIIRDDQVVHLLETLNGASSKVRDTKDTVLKLEHEQRLDMGVQEAEQHVRDVEDEWAFIIRNEKNEDGKPLHSNDTLRAGALRKALSQDKDYATHKACVIHAKTGQSQRVFELAKAKNTMDYRVNTFKTSIAAAGLIQGLCMEDNAEAKAVTLKKIADLIGDTRETK